MLQGRAYRQETVAAASAELMATATRDYDEPL
jgi:hypothetical protein